MTHFSALTSSHSVFTFAYTNLMDTCPPHSTWWPGWSVLFWSGVHWPVYVKGVLLPPVSPNNLSTQRRHADTFPLRVAQMFVCSWLLDFMYFRGSFPVIERSSTDCQARVAWVIINDSAWSPNSFIQVQRLSPLCEQSHSRWCTEL